MSSKVKYQPLPTEFGEAANLNGVPPLYSDDINLESSLDNSALTYSSSYKDVWATCLFVIHLVVAVVLSVLGFKNFVNNGTLEKRDAENRDFHIEISEISKIVVVAAILGFLFTMLYFLTMQKYGGKLIWGSFIINIVSSLLITVFGIVTGNIVAGAVSGAFAVIHIILALVWMKRIPFAKVMLQSVTTVTRSYPSTVFVGICGLVTSSVWFFIWTVLSVGASLLFFHKDSDEKDNSQAKTAGIAAEPNIVVVPVRNPCLNSAKRALTTSFGSICFGSLIVALIATLRKLAGMAKRRAREEGNSGLALVFSCVQCFVGCIEGYIEFLNIYAYTEVAAFGKSYCQAAKDTWEIIKSRGVDLIINADLISNVLGMGSILVGILTGFGAVVFTKYFSVYQISADQVMALYLIVFIVAFFFGLIQFSVIAQVIKSGVTTTFVCLAEDPDSLKRTKPDLYYKFLETYPELDLTTSDV
ncbi:putative choline transporter, neither null mutation nor overexpression affects choline transport [Clydaea vesicula]|uniref:Protein PNS1 n=1 Tax=Clydaea vesicula TaxID=447962 RepID=A0AAD5U0Q9_9FUNG|nr:putative choline transporter, neither null mutation nor overexpression affects choline transport [Clydaea vesicula]